MAQLLLVSEISGEEVSGQFARFVVVVLVAPIFGSVDGRIDVFEGALRSGRPLVIRGAHGLGQVVFVAVDLDTPPLKQWEGRPRLVELLLTDATANRDVDTDAVAQVAGWITPVPGGVGPMTITMLMKNTLKACQYALSK